MRTESKIGDIELRELERLGGEPLVVAIVRRKGLWVVAICPRMPLGIPQRGPVVEFAGEDLDVLIERAVVEFVSMKIGRRPGEK